MTPAPPRARFGVSLPNRAMAQGTPVEMLYEATALAEASGFFDSVWVGDNFVGKPRLEVMITLSILAARTERLKLGVACMATFIKRHPLEFAIQWASLDLVSRGRTILAVCLGVSEKSGPKFAAEFTAFRMNDAERIPRMIEGIELLRRFWSGEAVTHQSRFYRFDAIEALPKPVQTPPPIFIATNPTGDEAAENRALRRVARLADGWQTDPITPELYASRWRRIREFAAEYGRAGALQGASLHLMLNINDDREAAYAESMEFLRSYYGIHVPRERLESWFVCGSPAAVAERIQAYLDAGCTMPLVRFTSPHQLAQQERFLRDVAPLFRRHAAVTG